MQRELFDTTPALRKDAVLSACGRYRYRLVRVWDDALPLACWVMLNPSTADASVDDPTIRRCLAFARSWKCGGIDVRNLFALRATDPRALLAADDPVGPDNDVHLAGLAFPCFRVVLAWGGHGNLRGRAGQVRGLFAGEVKCLGVTATGQPRHPLYVRGDQPLVPYSWRTDP